MSNLTSGDFATFAIVLLAVSQLFNTLFSTWQNSVKMKEKINEPIVILSRKHDELAKRVERLEDHDEIWKRENEEQRKQNRIIMKAVQAMLNHEIHNGNTEEMIEASKDINDFLLGKSV